MSVDAEPLADRLPSYLTRFVGREQEIAELEAMLEPRGLVTICGVGGLGKTRLAFEVARRLSEAEKPPTDEVFWVPLTGTGPAELPTAIGQGIGLHALSGAEPLRALVAALRDAPVLLVIDNCEQIAEACGQLVAGLLAGCPRLAVLATSRIPLEVRSSMCSPSHYESRTARRPRSKRCDRFQPGADSIQLMISPATHVGHEV
jgi:predicted ATPase